MSTRWTVRNVDDDVIKAVRAVQVNTGRPLGDIVSHAIRRGLAAAVAEFEKQPTFEEMLDELSRTSAATQNAIQAAIDLISAH